MADNTPNIPSLSSQVSNEIRRAFDSFKAYFAAIKAQGGIVTRQDMVNSGLFDAELKPHTTQPPEGDSRYPVPTGIVVQEDIYKGNDPSVVKSRAIVTWDFMGPRVSGYELTLYDGAMTTILAQANTARNEWRFDDLEPGAYLVAIRSTTIFAVASKYGTESFILSGKDAIPAAPGSLSMVIVERWIKIVWTPPIDLDIAGYELRQGHPGDAGESASLIATPSAPNTSYIWAPNEKGTLRFWIRSVDRTGNKSTLKQCDQDLTITTPEFSGTATLVPQVIDNNVLLAWPNAIVGSYPVSHYVIRRGVTPYVFANATMIGTKQGTFTTVFETASANYKYWVSPVDTADLEGSPIAVFAQVAQPPDYLLLSAIYDDFASASFGSVTVSRTFTNCMRDGITGSLVGPLNTTETWQQHFENNAWSTPNDQINSGNPIFAQSKVTTAKYEVVLDYQTPLSSKLSLNATRLSLDGTVTVTPMISVKTLLGDAWTDYSGVYEVFAANFRYVKFTLNFTTADFGIMQVSALELKLDTKQQKMKGLVTCSAADAAGTVVYLTDDRTITGKKLFVDVDNIQVTAKGTGGVIAVYDFTDGPNPLSCTVMLFNTAYPPVRQNGEASITVEGK